MYRLATAFLLLVLLAAGGYGVLAYADNGVAANMAPGTRIAGVDVSGLTRDEALQRLRSRVGEQVGRPATVRVGQRTFTLSAEQAKVRIDLPRAVNRAFAAGREGNVVERGWRSLTGAEVDVDEDVPVTADAAAVRSFVGSIHSQIARKPVDASLELNIASVDVTRSRPGRRLAGRDDLVKRITTALTNRNGAREFNARAVKVDPKVTTDQVWEATPVAVTVARDSKTVRVFKKGKIVRTYRVAVGEPKYPTPTGQFTVQSMQKNPTWNVPQSEWAGDLAGQVIPGGDPRNPLVARWIGFNGSVGFHGTKSISSLGTSASHGCVRMSPGDVTDLFEQVEVGTPVLVA